MWRTKETTKEIAKERTKERGFHSSSVEAVEVLGRNNGRSSTLAPSSSAVCLSPLPVRPRSRSSCSAISLCVSSSAGSCTSLPASVGTYVGGAHLATRRSCLHARVDRSVLWHRHLSPSKRTPLPIHMGVLRMNPSHLTVHHSQRYLGWPDPLLQVPPAHNKNSNRLT